MVTHGTIYLDVEDYKIDDYYVSKDGGGRIFGRVAEKLNLAGDLTLEKHHALCSTILDPAQGAMVTWGRSGGKPYHRPGDDFTFSPEKSISVAWAFGTPEIRLTIQAAHEKGVLAAAKYIENNLMAYKVCSRGGQMMTINTGNAAMMMVTHQVSRMTEEGGTPDPNLHGHLVVYNITDVDGRGWKAIENYKIVSNSAMLNRIYNSEMKLELEKAGYQTVQDKKGNIKFENIKDEIKGLFSKRREQIMERAGEYKVDHRTKGDAQQVACLATRLGKEEKDWDKLKAEWMGQLMKAGHHFMDCFPKTDEKIKNYWAKAPKENIRENLDLMASTGVLAAGKEKAVFSKEDVIKAALTLVPGGAAFADVEKAVDDYLGNYKELYRIGDVRVGRNNTEVLYTTNEALKAESYIIEAGRKMKSVDVPLVHEFRVVDRELSREQQVAVRDMVQGKKLSLILGNAGTGKTRTLRELAAQVGEKDLVVIAPSNIAAVGAANEIGGTGRSIHSFLGLDRDKNEKYTPVKVRDKIVIIDECSMIDNDMMKRLLERCVDAKKVIMLGDDKQFSAVEAGDPWSLLLEFAGGKKRIEKIQRQTHEVYREAAQFIATPTPECVRKGLGKLDDLGWIKDGEVADLVAERVKKYEDETYICPTNARRQEINAMVRRVRMDRGELSDGGIDVVLDKSHTLDEDRDEIRRFAVGDKIICLQTDLRREVCNGTRGVVTSVDPRRGYIRFDVDVGQGQKMERVLDVNEYHHVEHAYAITGHKSQGATLDKTVAVLETGAGMINHQMVYVATTRGREKVEIITDDKEALYKKACDFARPLSATKALEFAMKQQQERAQIGAELGLDQGNKMEMGR